jgi:hypothetical protein
VRTLRQSSGNVGLDPTYEARRRGVSTNTYTTERPGALRLFQTSRVVLLLPQGEGLGEGEGITLSFTAFFSAVGSGLNSTENSEKP